MKLQLDIELNIEVLKQGESLETLTIFLRDYTKEENKKFADIIKKFKDLSRKGQKLVTKAGSIEKKMDLYEKAGKFDKAIEMAEASDKLILDLDKITKSVDDLGGDEFHEGLAKESFDIRISGEDKEQLRDIAEIKGYSSVMKLLEKEKERVEKKQHGE